MSEEQVVLLDDDGQEIGTAEKYSIHHENTPLHKAFSCYVFDEQGRLLVTKRASVKKVWPGVWTNTACGHPMPRESDEDAIARRLKYELGMTAQNLQCVKKDYRYKTLPFKGIIEHELCPIYIGSVLTDPIPNPLEVDEYTWLPWAEYVNLITADTGDVYSWWCKDQLQYISDSVENFLKNL